MALPKLKSALSAVAGAALAATPLTATHAQQAHPQPVAASSITTQLVDARKNGPVTVLAEASALSGHAPGIAISGYNETGFNTVRDGVRMAASNGYTVSRLVLGPQNAEPNLTILINGVRVTNPINPNTITSDQLSRLIEELSVEYYPERYASARQVGGPIALRN